MNIVDNYPMSKITTLQIGGPAKKFVIVKTAEELQEAINFAKENNLEFLVIGGGSNLLVSDEGVDKLIIKNDITGISISNVGSSPKKVGFVPTDVLSFEVEVNSGTVLQELVDYTIQHGLSGLQKLTGIPGTVGGAVFGNAGAYGQTISDYLVEVSVINPSVIPASEPESIQIYGSRSVGRPVKHGMTKEECDFNYRDSGFKKNHYTILEIKFQLQSEDPIILSQEAKEVLSKRLVKYPVGIKCPGSFFKNLVADKLPKEVLKQIPQDKITYGKISAGYLLEAVGAQGQKLDGIEIASYHANLFVNKGGGSAQAFYNLAKKYADLVKQKFGITLEPEVQLINLPPLV